MNELRDIRTAQYLANLLYNAGVKDDDFEELALIALQRIGNVHTELKKARLHIDPETHTAELPCDADLIEAITYDYEDPYLSSNIHEPGDIYKTHVENYIERRKAFENPYYISGKFVKEQIVDGKIKVPRNYGSINILYHSLILGDDDLPKVNDKEIDAIAAFVAYYNLYRKGLSTANANLIQMANSINWRSLMDEARNPVYLDQNDMDKILDVKSSYDRKVHNRSYKPIK